jgi:hypothetical protein
MISRKSHVKKENLEVYNLGLFDMHLRMEKEHRGMYQNIFKNMLCNVGY